jgi:hypothetical protein
MPNTRNRVLRITLTALSTALLAACGGDSDSAAPGAAATDSTAPAPATASRSVTLTWYPPTQTIDGAPLSNLRGYRIYWGTEAGRYTNSVTLDNAGLASYVVEQLTPARWHFAVTALTSNGIESSYSNEFSTTVR